METAELLRKVRRLEIRSRRLVADVFAGNVESLFKGRGIEFEEVRHYVPGDEVRDIDWNVTARFGAPFVKRFVEERELTVLLVVDVTRSMRFGTTGVEKRELAAELCAVLALAAQRHNDRVGLVLAGRRVEHFVRPARGRSHVLRLLRDVLSAEARAGPGDTREAVRFLLRTARRHSVIFWISDFADPLEARDWRVLGRRHDVTALLLRDPRDEVLPAVGWVELEDLESGTRRLLDTGSRRAREAYRRDALARLSAATRALSRARCPVVVLDTGRSWLPVLMRYFSERRRGRRA
ncbi:MAG TPA: DUF58 domain-containing protein [Terriglobales bacterium]|nr:DUF58 domain-containing protein [Terriglobales bacterium]